LKRSQSARTYRDTVSFRRQSPPKLWNPVDHLPRQDIYLNRDSIRFADTPVVYQLPLQKETHTVRTTTVPRLGPSKSVPRRVAQAKARRSGLSPEVLESYFTFNAKIRPISMASTVVDLPPRTPKSRGNDQDHAHNIDLEQGLPRIPPPSFGAPSQADESYIAEEAGSEHYSEDEESEWGPKHPCYPHINPHIPTTSSLQHSTRIIRIKRDWMIAGDLAPTYSNLYPEILDPWVSEEEFRIMVSHVNETLIKAYDPFDWRNILDVLLGLLTLWFWDDFGLTAVKSRLRRLESYLDDWNKRKFETAKSAKAGADGDQKPPPSRNTATTTSVEPGEKSTSEKMGLVKIYPLRQTGYMSIDIQIPDPKLPMYASTNSRDPTNGGNGIESSVPGTGISTA
jgi:hypothetical protein